MEDDGFSYDWWMQIITETFDHELRDDHVDINYGDNRNMRRQELNYASDQWETIQFYKRRWPNTDDFTDVLNHMVTRLPLFSVGQSRQFRLAQQHQDRVSKYLNQNHYEFREEDRKFILDRELYLANEYFESDADFDLYTDASYLQYRQKRLDTLMQRFIAEYPSFYAPYQTNLKEGQLNG